ncbi:MAG: S24 family peptidase [Brevundimonas sp.]|uniref:S24 family peptidase n=1 Tax=Brevundimonas sp. TaxID=1871086 RepID=UPI003002EC07
MHQDQPFEVRFAHHTTAHDVRQSHSLSLCDFRILPGMDSPDDIKAALQRLGVPHEEIANAIGKDRTVATKIFGTANRRIQAAEIAPLKALIAKYETARGETGDLASTSLQSYVEVEVLPTFAGMGGGGTGDDDRTTALLSRALVEDQLRAKPSDLLVINVRGDSMEPVFLHDDQVVIDRRDRNPRQPGPFALWFDDGYVLKNVEYIRKSGTLRIFSSNPIYSPDEADPEDVTIMGRPVWFARRM